MRGVFLSDLHHAACALRAFPQQYRVDLACIAIMQARCADLYRKAHGRVHPQWGNGSLSGVFGPVDAPDRCDRAYLDAMAAIIAALMAENSADGRN